MWVRSNGINPLNEHLTRGNSLIVVAKKVAEADHFNGENVKPSNLRSLTKLQTRLNGTISRIDRWAESINSREEIVGFGAGGRGVMTLAAIEKFERFSALFDSNYTTGELLSPKSRRPIIGPNEWSIYNHAYCLVFSFGYFNEIRDQLISKGFEERKIISLEKFFPETD